MADTSMLHTKWGMCYLLLPFGPKGARILGTCQHMYHRQCLIILMVARRRCPQCKVGHFTNAYMNILVFKRPCHNIRNTTYLTHPIGHKHGPHTWNGFGMLARMTWGNPYDEWQYDESMIQKARELLYLLRTNTRCCWFYQMFQGWYNPITNKFEYGLNSKHDWHNTMGEEIKWGFTISNFQLEDQANLTLEKTSERTHLKDDVAFALLIAITPHTITMFNEINNPPKLDAILNGKPIGLGNCVSWQHGSNIGKSSNRIRICH